MKLKIILLLPVLLLTGCQISIITYYPEMPVTKTGVKIRPARDIIVNQSIYKSNSGHSNWLDQNTDASASIPASIMGTGNTRTTVRRPTK